MTQRELARIVGIGDTPMGRILNGEAAPRPETLIAVCQALRVYPSWVLLGLLPAYFEDSAEPAPPPPRGIDRWLDESAEGRAATDDEKAWMRTVPWPAPHVRHPDMVYAMILLAYRQALSTSQSSPALQPVVVKNDSAKRVG